MPGSHHPPFNEALRDIGAARVRDPSLPGHVVATDPGDVILMDEHVLHAAFGGSVRRQWRVDYLGVPVGIEESILTKSYFDSLYEREWDGRSCELVASERRDRRRPSTAHPRTMKTRINAVLLAVVLA